MKPSLIHRLGRWLLLAVLTLFLVTLLAGAAAAWLLPRLGDYRSEVAALLSTQLQAEVSFSGLQGRWHGGRPEIAVQGLVAERPGGYRLAAEQVRLGPALWPSLLQRQLVLHHLEIDGAALRLSRWPASSTHSPASAPQAAPHPDEWLGALARVRQLRVSASSLAMALPDLPILEISAIDLAWELGLTDWQLRGRADLHQGEARRPVELRSRARRLPGLAPGSGQLYLHLSPLTLGPWLATWKPEIRQLIAGGELWLDWNAEGVNLVSGRLEVEQLQWALGQGELSLDNAEGRFRAEQSAGWDLQLDQLRGTLDGQVFAGPQVRARWSEERLAVSADALDLAPLGPWAKAAAWLHPQLRAILSELQPEGQMRGIQLDLPLTDPLAFTLHSDLKAVGVSASQGIPELRGVDGLLRLHSKGGRVDFESEQFRMHFPRLYDQGWDYSRARGVVHWIIRQSETLIESEHLALQGPTVQADGRFSVRIPREPGEPANLTLLIGMRDTDARLTRRYVPDRPLDPSLKHWLAGAIEGGLLNRGLFLFHGPTGASPEPVTTQMFYDVSNGTMRYHPDWPGVQDAEVKTLIKGRETLVLVDRGRIYDTRIQRAEVRLPAEGPSHLQIAGRLGGDARDIARVLQESPLREYTGDLRTWSLAGDAQSRLALIVPLQGGQPRVAVHTALQKGRFASESLGLAFEAIEGTLDYSTERGLRARGLRGRFFGQPVTATISGQVSKQIHTRVALEGRLPMGRLQEWLRFAPLSLASGTTDYRAELDLCGTSLPDCTQLRVSSNLAGVALDLPPPWGKSAAEARDLTVQLLLDDKLQRLRLDYDPRLSLALRLQEGAFLGGELHLFGQAGWGTAAGLVVRGRLPRADAGDWQRWWERVQSPLAAASDASEADAGVLRNLQLQVEELSAAGRRWRNLSIGLRADSGSWLLHLGGPQVEGQVRFSRKSEVPWQVRLAYLRLPELDETAAGSEAAEPSDPLAAFDPSQLPAADIAMDELTLGGRDYGHWRWQTRPIAGGVALREVEGELRHLQVTGGLDWTRSDTGPRTHLRLRAATEDLGQVLVAWDNPKSLESQAARASGELAWDASPLGFNRRTLNGDLEFRVENGRFLDASAAGNTLRVFGLMNLNTLGRRLRLDFSDLLQEGISFDHIQGRYLFNLGVGVSDGPLTITGPSADFALEGSLNLAERKLDQVLTLTLPLSENLPIAAVLLGAPQVAGAVFLIEKLVGKQIARFTSARYSIYGSWDDPQVELLRAPRQEQSPAER